jgi:hypothetical protein
MKMLTSIFSIATAVTLTTPAPYVHATALTTSVEPAPALPRTLADALEQGLQAKSRADACFMIELQKTDGWQPSAEELAACTSRGVVGRADVATSSRFNMSARIPVQDRQFACFLTELKKTDGYQPSTDDDAACQRTPAEPPTGIASSR